LKTLKVLYLIFFLIAFSCDSSDKEKEQQKPNQYITVLGIAQDAGYPQINCEKDCCKAYYEGKESALKDVAKVLKVSLVEDSATKAATFVDEVRSLRKEIDKLKKQMASGSMEELFSNPEEVNGTKIIVANVPDCDMDQLRAISDQAKDKYEDCVVLLASGNSEKVNLVAGATKKAVKKGVHVGNVIREVAKVTGGGGGGRPDMAQAGGKIPEKIDEALLKAKEIVEAQVK
jgi:alanyl-tRNA synthetase